MRKESKKEARKKTNFFADLKEALSVDTEDDDNEELYKNLQHGRGPGAKDYRKPKDAKGTILRILSYTVENKILLVGVLLLMLIATGCSLASSYFLKPIVDDYIIPNIGAAEKDYSGLARQLIILGGLYIAGVAATYLQNRTMMNLAQWAVNRIRAELFDKLQKLPLSYFDEHTHGELMSRFINDADHIQMAMEQGFLQFVSGIITFAGTVVLMIVLSWKLFIITFFVILLVLYIVKKIGGLSKILFKKQQAALGMLNGYIEEMVDGLKAVKAFGYEERTKAEFNELDDAYRENAILANFLGHMVMPTLHSIMNLCYGVSAVVGGTMVIGGTFSVGSLGLFLSYIRQVTNPINMMSNQLVNLMSAVAGAERIFRVMDTKPEEDEGKVTLVTAERGADGELTEVADGHRTGFWAWKIPETDESGNTAYRYKEVLGDVELRDVCFSYIEGQPILKHITMHAPPGHKLALVGSTGAGKTTITNLINRFYEIDSGAILFDGIDVKDIAKAGLRRSLGIVLQDTNLFTGTVMENIRYGKLDASDEECIQAAKTANAHGFITRLPNGYDTVITGNGQNLSQGQRQLLAIARTAVAKHPVMILDEATSSIDTRTEKLIEKGMDSLMEGKTVFVIAHRLSTVRNSQTIAVIEHGEIEEMGDHDELLEKQGRYYTLYTGQTELD